MMLLQFIARHLPRIRLTEWQTRLLAQWEDAQTIELDDETVHRMNMSAAEQAALFGEVHLRLPLQPVHNTAHNGEDCPNRIDVRPITAIDADYICGCPAPPIDIEPSCMICWRRPAEIPVKGGGEVCRLCARDIPTDMLPDDYYVAPVIDLRDRKGWS